MLRSRRNSDNFFYFEPRSGDRYPLDIPRWCADGPKPLLISPQPGIGRDEIDRGTRSLWRYQASLPVEISKPISIGEGCTPLVQKEWGDFRPFFKLEWFNPTCSFKDRGTTVMLSYLRQLGIDAVLEDSSGNGGASVAAYGAAGGMRVKILAPAYTSPAKVASRLWRRGAACRRAARRVPARGDTSVQPGLLFQPQLAALLPAGNQIDRL
jgi:threonine synthase